MANRRCRSGPSTDPKPHPWTQPTAGDPGRAVTLWGRGPAPGRNSRRSRARCRRRAERGRHGRAEPITYKNQITSELFSPETARRRRGQAAGAADRAKAAMPFRGDDRLVDFVLSILVNGGYLRSGSTPRSLDDGPSPEYPCRLTGRWRSAWPGGEDRQGLQVERAQRAARGRRAEAAVYLARHIVDES